jgi:D-3-phosphoglycerate dehydrogenase / 2-oxoglutarate reductase
MNALVTGFLTESGLARLGEWAHVELAGQAIGDKVLTPAELAAELQDKQIVIVEFEQITREVIETSKLKVIGCTRGGPQANIDIAAATKKGIPVLYAPGRNATAVVELVFCLMISLARHVAHAHHLIKTGHFLGPPAAGAVSERRDVVWGVEKGSPYDLFKGPELAGRTLGVVGFGQVGKRLAKRAQGFEMNMLVFDPFIPERDVISAGARPVDLETLLKESDFVSLHCKVTPETRGLMSEKQFSLMKPSAYLINTARGAIVDEKALVGALKQKQIAGAGLDVFQQEPLPADSSLLDLDNVVLVPHIGGASIDVEKNHTEIIIDGLKSLFAGDRPMHCANREVLDIFRWE